MDINTLPTLNDDRTIELNLCECLPGMINCDRCYQRWLEQEWKLSEAPLAYREIEETQAIYLTIGHYYRD